MILRLFLLAPVLFVLLLAALCGLSRAPLGRRYTPRGGPDVIVPMNVRDPSALVMGPYLFLPKAPPPPSIEKPR